MVATIALSAASEQAEADMRLLMFEEPGCVWCARWNADVGGEYPITPEGRAAPLMRLQLRDPLPEDISLVSRPRYTPTFVVVSDGEGSAGSKAIRARISSGAFWAASWRGTRPMVERPPSRISKDGATAHAIPTKPRPAA